MNTWTYTKKYTGNKFYGTETITVMQLHEKEITICTPIGFEHNSRMYKTVNGARRWVERKYPDFKLTEERIRVQY